MHRPGGFRGPYTHETLFHEPLVLFGYLAAINQQLELVTGILILPQRQTALVAKQATEVDVLSGGRLRLGVGVGWNSVEYDALGENFKNRGRRVEEQVALLRALWAGCDTLLLDEPFTGMDPETMKKAAALLKERRGERAVLLATHDREAIRELGWRVIDLT